ncbi:MAG TPA: 3-oxo-tetronate kinase [Galbitalea sp.]|jgi:uncharacterized protein YgbK (DUF1537 family)
MIGAIADDFTGGTDVAVAFRREGLRTLLYFGVPDANTVAPAADAAVVAIKSRMSTARDAVRESTAALEWLRANGAEQLYFKYCSTFDSTSRGNIGPVLDALSELVGSASVVQTPSSPEHFRTQYQGYLFVGEELLSDSHMRNHPVTPMHDSALRRLLGKQTSASVGVIPLATVRQGVDSIRKAIAKGESAGDRYLFADAIDRDDLLLIGRAVVDDLLVAGAAGLAGGLAAAIAESSTSLIGHNAQADDVSPHDATVVLAGSCAARTLEQIAVMKDLGHPSLRLDPLALPDAAELSALAIRWYDGLPRGAAPLIYTSLEPEPLAEVQRKLGVAHSARILEDAIGMTASALVERGVNRIITAGGETSGAVVKALSITEGLIGPEEAPGVPWILTARGVSLLLKSGNFGANDLLATASAR